MLNGTKVLTATFLLLFSLNVHAQPVAAKKEIQADSLSYVFTLNDCIRYALKNQPAVNQAYIDESIAHANNMIALSTWLPQVNGTATAQHYFKAPPAFTVINGVATPVQAGSYNTAIPSVGATQTIFNTDVLLVSRAAKLNTQSAEERTASAKIELVANVSKAFYDLLLSRAQVTVFKDDTARLAKNLSDAYHRYVSGVSDKVDYQQATISLNNSRSQLKTASEQIHAKYAVLQQYMGFPPERKFTVEFDTTRMMQEIFIDTLAPLQFNKRIEYQQLLTARRLQHETTLYYQLGFLPSLSAFYNYSYEYINNKVANLFDKHYAFSYIGLQLNLPIFTGLRRIENIRKANLQERRIDWDEVNLELTIYSQYSQALSAYKSSLYYLHTQSENVALAREVYGIVKLQYSEGIKAYLDVIVAETALQSAEISYLNALFLLLSSKIDLVRAMGDISPDI